MVLTILLFLRGITGDLAGYPANDFAGYRISGLIVNLDFFLKQNIEFFRSLFYSNVMHIEKILKKVGLFEGRIICSTVYPADYPAKHSNNPIFLCKWY